MSFSLSLYLSALEEDVAVSLEVVTGSSRAEAEFLSESPVSPLSTGHPLASAATGGVPARLLAGQLTEVPGGVAPVTRAQETLK